MNRYHLFLDPYSKQLFQILKDAGIELRQGNISQFVKTYGISNPKSVDVEYIDKRTGSANRVSTYKNPKSFYVKPTATELKKIKEQYNINILKKTDKGPGKIAFDKRNKRAKQLLKTKKYTKLLREFLAARLEILLLEL